MQMAGGKRVVLSESDPQKQPTPNPNLRRRMNRSTRSLAGSLTALCVLAAGTLVGSADTLQPHPVPRAVCAPGDTPERGVQGRLSSEDARGGYAANGITCNTEIVSRFGTPGVTGGAGGYKVHRFVDDHGRECAYYDTTLLAPLNAPKVATDLVGVIVLDMTDPAAPVKTANLVTPAMLSPHESLSINEARGLLAATAGNPVFKPGQVDIYSIREDCRNPILLSTTPTGLIGHEAAFSPDGKTFWVTSTNLGFITAIDVTEPALPSVVWTTRGIGIHGFSISDDGTRFYGANAANRGLTILDVSQVQARVPQPVVTQVAHVSWPTVSIPQHTIPVTIGGDPFLIEMDEFAAGPTGDPTSKIGAARIISILDETAPAVVSDLRLEIHEPENIAASRDDPGAQWGLGGYTGHYCAVPRREEPGIVACSFILSGLRVFDISDPYAPKEIAYFNAPIAPADGVPGGSSSSITPHAAYAMSAPAFVPERREIWYSDGSAGFFNLRVTNDAWTS
jgi:hypothetical protein